MKQETENASKRQNDIAQLRAENQRVSEVEAAPGGALADAPCSTSSFGRIVNDFSEFEKSLNASSARILKF